MKKCRKILIVKTNGENKAERQTDRRRQNNDLRSDGEVDRSTYIVGLLSG